MIEWPDVYYSSESGIAERQNNPACVSLYWRGVNNCLFSMWRRRLCIPFDCWHRNLHLGVRVSYVCFEPFFPLICETTHFAKTTAAKGLYNWSISVQSSFHFWKYFDPRPNKQLYPITVQTWSPVTRGLFSWKLCMSCAWQSTVKSTGS